MNICKVSSSVKREFIDGSVCMLWKNHWQSEHYYLGDEVFFDSIGLHLSVAEIYDRVGNEDMRAYLQGLATE